MHAVSRSSADAHQLHGVALSLAALQNSQSLDMLWQDGTCKQLGLHGALNTSLITALQAMVNASNPAGVAALLNSRISGLESDAGGSAAAAQVRAGLCVHSPCTQQAAVLSHVLSPILTCRSRVLSRGSDMIWFMQ